MADFLLLLRGINVGKANRLPMATLTAVVEQLGFGSVKTLLNSGNLLFNRPAVSDSMPDAKATAEAAAEAKPKTSTKPNTEPNPEPGTEPNPEPNKEETQLADQISAALLAATGLDLHCIVKSAARCRQIDAALQSRLAALADAGHSPNPSHFLIGVSRDSDTLQAFKAAAGDDPGLQLSAQALLLNCPGGMNQSASAELLVSKKWRLITCRNLATWQKIMALLAPDAGDHTGAV